MCRIITPDENGGHAHAHEPLEVAELLRDNLVQELATMGDLAGHLHGMDDEAGARALEEAIAHKRAAIDVLYRALQEAENQAFPPREPKASAKGRKKNA